jgi:hypothetical protein
MTQLSYSSAFVKRLLGSIIVCAFRHYRVTKLHRRMKIWVRNLLDSEDPEIHPFCFSMIEQVGGEWAAETVLNIPSHKMYSYGEVLPVLVRISTPALEPLKTCIETPGYVNRCLALDALVGIAGDDVFEYVFDLFKCSTDRAVRGFCVYLFRFFSPDLAVPALLYALEDGLDDGGVYGVVMSLSVIQDDMVVGPLIQALDDGIVLTNLRAVLGLGNIFNDEAVKALQRAGVIGTLRSGHTLG